MLEKEEFFDFEVRSPEGNNEEISVLENLPIVLKKEKRLHVKYPTY